MTRRPVAGRALGATVLIAVVAVFCLGDLVHAASMPGHDVDHSGRMCGERGCQTSTVSSPLWLPVLATTGVSLARALPVALLPAGDGSPAARHDRIAPRAPRSPPSA